MAKNKVIIIGHGAASNLGLARSVGRLGCEVVLIYSRSVNSDRDVIEKYSRYINEYYTFNSWTKTALISFLVDYKVDMLNKPYLIMTDDKSAYWIASSRDIIEEKYHCPKFGLEEWPTELIFDKSFQKEKALEAGFNVVKSWTIDLSQNDYTIPTDITFPCYVKGAISFNTPKGFQKRCQNLDELRLHLNKINKASPSVVLIEPYVKIENECGALAFCDAENIVIPALVYFNEIGCEKRPGVSMIGKVTSMSHKTELIDHIKSFLKSLNITGICNIDFFEVDGKLYFVELNLRYSAYSYGICYAGVNIPAICVGIEPSSGKTSISKQIVYCNETVAAERLIEGSMSICELLSLPKKTDVSCVFAKDDRKPYRYLLYYTFLRKCKVFIRSLFN